MAQEKQAFVPSVNEEQFPGEDHHPSQLLHQIGIPPYLHEIPLILLLVFNAPILYSQLKLDRRGDLKYVERRGECRVLSTHCAGDVERFCNAVVLEEFNRWSWSQVNIGTTNFVNNVIEMPYESLKTYC